VAINHLDMCSGIGGWAIAFRELGINTVAFCEIDKYPRQVLQKNFPGVPIFNDLKELTYEDIKERTGVDGIDILTCSYPCQPFSVAGKQKGEEDPRHLWPDTFRLVQECRPTWFVGENVSGHIKLGLDTVLEDLESEGYDTRTFIIPASSVGAWHKRERLWIIGYSEHNGSLATKKSRKHQETARGTSQGQNQAEQFEGASRPSNHENVSYTDNDGCEGGYFKTRNQIATRQNNASIRGTCTDNSCRPNDDRRNKAESRVTEKISKPRNGNTQGFTTSRGVHKVSEKPNQCDQDSKTHGYQKDHHRTLVQEGQAFQSSKSRGLGENQTTSKTDKVRQSDDHLTQRRVDTKNVSDTESLRFGRGSGEECRTPQWQFLQEEQERREVWREAERCTTSYGEDVSDTSSEGLQRFNVKSSVDESQLGQSTDYDDARGQENWWQTQSELCGVPDGISYELDKGRVGRIKGLGNAIVPQIAWFIGNAIVSAQNTQEDSRQ